MENRNRESRAEADLCGPPLCVAYTSPTIFCSPMKKVQDFLKNCKSVQLMVNHWWSASDRGHYGHIARDNDKWQHNDNEKWNRVAWTLNWKSKQDNRIYVFPPLETWANELERHNRDYYLPRIEGLPMKLTYWRICQYNSLPVYRS